MNKQPGVLRDGRTLLPTTAREIAQKINGNPSAAPGIAEKLMALLSRAWIAYLRWDLRSVERAVADIPRERKLLLEHNNWKHQHRALEINCAAARREVEGSSRIEEIKSHLRRMGVEA